MIIKRLEKWAKKNFFLAKAATARRSDTNYLPVNDQKAYGEQALRASDSRLEPDEKK
jgi:hypothetical protein